MQLCFEHDVIVFLHHVVMVLYFGETLIEYDTFYGILSQLANHYVIKTI